MADPVDNQRVWSAIQFIQLQILRLVQKQKKKNNKKRYFSRLGFPKFEREQVSIVNPENLPFLI